MEDPLMPFLFRLYESLIPQRHQVLFHPTDLLPAHAATLDIDRNPRQMRRRLISLLGSGVAVVTAQLLLYLDGANRRVDLYLAVKLVVIGFAQVFEEIARPRTAIAAAGIEPAINLQILAFDNRNQFLAGNQLLQLCLILNARQLQAVDLRVLPQQRISRRTEHRVPQQAADVNAALHDPMRMPHRDVLVQTKSLTADGNGQQKHQTRPSYSHFHEVDLLLRACYGANAGGHSNANPAQTG